MAETFARIILKLGIMLSVAVPSAVAAEYCSVGPIKGQVCDGFVFEVCHMTSVDAIEQNGELFTVSRCYDNVDDYRASDGRCWIRTKSTGWGVLSWVINWFTKPPFYTMEDGGGYREVDVEYLTFKCEEQ